MKRLCRSILFVFASLSIGSMTYAHNTECNEDEVDRFSHNLVTCTYPEGMQDLCPNLQTWLDFLDDKQCLIVFATESDSNRGDEAGLVMGILQASSWRDSRRCGVLTPEAFVGISSSIVFPDINLDSEAYLQGLEEALLKGDMATRFKRLENPQEFKQKILRVATMPRTELEFPMFYALKKVKQAGVFFMPKKIRTERYGRLLSFVLGGIGTGFLLTSAYHYPVETLTFSGLSLVLAGTTLKSIHSKQKRAISDADKRWKLSRDILDEVWGSSCLNSNMASIERSCSGDGFITVNAANRATSCSSLLSAELEATWEKVKHGSQDLNDLPSLGDG